MKTTTNMLLLGITGCLVWIIGESTFAQQNPQEELTQSDVTEQNQMVAPVAIEDAAADIEEWFEKVKAEFGLPDFGELNGKIFEAGSQPVSLKSLDPQFGDALANAYEIAVTKAQENLLMVRYGTLVTDKAREFYRDGSTNAKDIPLDLTAGKTLPGDKVMALFEKSLDVADKKLDAELAALGVSPNELQTMPVIKKKKLFSDKFLRNTLKKASGEIAGIVPIQTAVTLDKNGNAKVGVVLMLTPKTIQIAKDISMQRKSLVSGKGVAASTLLPSNEKEYLGQRGVRLFYDIDGTPAIISYGLGAYVPDGDDDYINAELKEDAKQAAMDMADAQIAEFVAGRMSAESLRQNGEEIEKTVEREMTPDSMSMEKTIKNIIKICQGRSKTQANLKMQGLSTLGSKYFKLPTGQDMVYVVRVWKYSTLNAITRFNAIAENPANAASPVKEGENASGAFHGRRIMELEDF